MEVREALLAFRKSSSGKLLPHTPRCQQHNPAGRCWWKIMASPLTPPFRSQGTAFNWQILSRDLRWKEYGKCTARFLISALQDVLRKARMDRLLLVYFVLENFLLLKDIVILGDSFFFSKHCKVLMFIYVSYLPDIKFYINSKFVGL